MAGWLKTSAKAESRLALGHADTVLPGSFQALGQLTEAWWGGERGTAECSMSCQDRVGWWWLGIVEGFFPFILPNFFFKDPL